MNASSPAGSGRLVHEERDRKQGDPVAAAGGSNGFSRFAARLCAIALIAAAAIVGQSDNADAYVSCIGTPHANDDPVNGWQFETWFFDPDTATCGSEESGFGVGGSYSTSEAFTEQNGPLGGFSIYTDDDKIAIIKTYQGEDESGNPTPGVGPSNPTFNRVIGYSRCNSRLLRVDDPDPSDGNGQYEDNDTSNITWDDHLPCRSGGGPSFLYAKNERYVVHLTMTGLNDGVTYNVIVDLTARSWKYRASTGVQAAHWVHSIIVWGGAFGAAPTSEAVKNFMIRRAKVIMDEEPDLNGRLLGDDGPVSKANLLGLQAQGEKDHFNVSFQTSIRAVQAQSDVPLIESPIDIWTKAKFVHVDHDDLESDIALFYLGVDYRLSQHTMVGILAQMDWISETSDGSHNDAKGIGWLVGPYAVMRLHDNLILDGRVAYGMSDNEIRIETYDDEFETTRWLAKVQLTGDFTASISGLDLAINPFLRAIYFSEQHGDYTNGLGAHVEGESIELARVYFGPKISTRFKDADGNVFAPHATLTAYWDLDEPVETDGSGNVATEDDLHGRVAVGITFASVEGFSVHGEGFYGGVGSDEAESFGGSLRLTIHFGGAPRSSAREAKQLAADEP